MIGNKEATDPWLFNILKNVAAVHNINCIQSGFVTFHIGVPVERRKPLQCLVVVIVTTGKHFFKPNQKQQQEITAHCGHWTSYKTLKVDHRVLRNCFFSILFFNRSSLYSSSRCNSSRLSNFNAVHNLASFKRLERGIQDFPIISSTQKIKTLFHCRAGGWPKNVWACFDGIFI